MIRGERPPSLSSSSPWLVGVSLALALAARVLLVRVHAAAAPEDLPALTVEAVYPGATASVAEQKLAAPLEEQINGVEHLPCLAPASRPRRLVPAGDQAIARHRLRPRPEARPEPGRGRSARDPRGNPAARGSPSENRRPACSMLICLYSRDTGIGSVDLSKFANVLSEAPTGSRSRRI